ncbi:hypothetical protein GCM10009736_28450 [Actinomadura bangladeshensis]
MVHFEIIGADPVRLQGYYGELFGWDPRTGDAVSEEVSQPGVYGFVDGATTGDGDGINGGIGGGAGHRPNVLFYVGVPDVEEALAKAEGLGGGAPDHEQERRGDVTGGGDVEDLLRRLAPRARTCSAPIRRLRRSGWPACSAVRCPAMARSPACWR